MKSEDIKLLFLIDIVSGKIPFIEGLSGLFISIILNLHKNFAKKCIIFYCTNKENEVQGSKVICPRLLHNGGPKFRTQVCLTLTSMLLPHGLPKIA